MSKLKEIRKMRQMSQGELAKIVGTSSVNISYLELKKRGLSEEWIAKLSKALNCTKAQLLGEQPIHQHIKSLSEIRNSQRSLLYSLRVSKGLSINELAKKIRVSRQLLWAFENGKNQISAELLKKIAKTLNAPEDYFLIQNESEQKIEENIPIKDEYLGYAIEIIDEIIDHDFYSRSEKTHILHQVYKIVYDFFENNDNKKEFVKDLEQKIVANQGVLDFLNRHNFKNQEPEQIKNKINKKRNGQASKRIYR